MIHFLLFQIVPLILIRISLARLERHAWFRCFGVTAVFLLGALVQLSLWLFSHPNLDNPDSLGYFRLGHGLETDLRAILFRPKLYPIFLGCFHSLKSATFFQCVLKLASGFFILRFSKLLAWRPGTTVFILLLYFLNSLWLQEPLRIMDTTVFTFLFSAFLWLAVENAAAFSFEKFTALCLAAGLAGLTRQAGDLSIVLVGASLALALVLGKRINPGLLILPVLLGALIACAGLVENGFRYGVYKRSVAMGINLYTHASFYALADPASPEWRYVEHFLPEAGKRYPAWSTDYAQDVPWSVNALPHVLERAMMPNDAETILACDRELTRRFLFWAEGKPEGYLASVGNEAMRLLWKCEEFYPESLLDKLFRVPVLLRRLERGIIHQQPGLLLGLALGGFMLGRNRRLLLALPLIGIGAYLLLIAAVQVGFTRYALPVLPWLLILAGQACDCLAGRSQASSEST